MIKKQQTTLYRARKIINSDFLNNIDTEKAKEKIIKKLEEINYGTKQTKFRVERLVCI